MSILKLTSDTLAGSPAAGEIEYNGQFFATDSNNARAQMQRFVQETSKTASGTSVDFTGIPAWVKRITVMFSGVSTSGTSVPLIQLGDSGGIENTGYSGTSSNITTAVTTASYTTGFGIGSANASTQLKGGSIILTLIDSASNLWAASGVIGRGDADGTAVTGGYKALSSVLTQIRITTVNCTDTFDAGSINIIYEG
jgi:hypothetical protein